jgi:lipoprotein NlpI
MDSSASTARGLGGVLLCICLVFSLAGCVRLSRYLYLSNCEREAKKATKAIETAKNSAQRATAYADRGDAYAEKARYSRAFKLISSDEYDRLFELAIKDHDQAIALDPDNPEMYYRRGRTFYFRAALDLMDGANSKGFFVPAKADFSTTIDKNPRHVMALDMRGLIDEDTGDLDQAISDFAQEAALNVRSRYRLADAYCKRGSFYLRDKKYDPAVSDFEKAIDIESSTDPCECEPYNPLVSIYLDERADYRKARAVVDRAQKAGKAIAPEYLKKLKMASNSS